MDGYTAFKDEDETGYTQRVLRKYAYEEFLEIEETRQIVAQHVSVQRARYPVLSRYDSPFYSDFDAEDGTEARSILERLKEMDNGDSFHSSSSFERISEHFDSYCPGEKLTLESSFASKRPHFNSRSSSVGNDSVLSRISSSSSSNASVLAKPLDFREFESGFDEEFQTLMDVVRADIGLFREHETFLRLRNLVQDFQHAAMTYGKIIISEKHLRPENKTIKPVADVGGVAGGEKYIAGNIFFRFPLDDHHLYGSEELAAKEANHQMKGLTAMYDTSVSTLNLPLLAIIKYRGYKLVAMSVLPIQGAHTLCYGSNDGGQNVQVQAHSLELMEQVSRALNLAEHPVRYARRKAEEVWVHMPCDLEVHRVQFEGHKDFRYYVVDFARLFPPQPPFQILMKLIALYGRRSESAKEEDLKRSVRGGISHKGSHLVYLLRPELVRRFHRPLSSDAFTRFAAPGYQVFDDDVVDCLKYLLEQIIPEAISKLESSISNDGFCPDITTFLHRSGINMRFLGVVFERVESTILKQKILVEAVARVVKAIIRGTMRAVHPRVRTAVQSPYIDAVTVTLNHIFGASTCTNPSQIVSGGSVCAHRCCCSCKGISDEEEVYASSECVKNWELMYDRATIQNTLKASSGNMFVDLEDAKEECERRRFWCTRLPAFLHERFFFSKDTLSKGLVDIIGYQFKACSCCNCSWKNVVTPEKLFKRVEEMCGIILSPRVREDISNAAGQKSVLRSSCPRSELNSAFPSDNISKCPPPKFLRSHSGIQSVELSPKLSDNSFSLSGERTETFSFTVENCFDLVDPFGVGDIVEVSGSTTVIPIMDYARGTEAQIRAQVQFGKGNVKESKRLAEIAEDSLTQGITKSPMDARLRCNFALLKEMEFNLFSQGSEQLAFELFLENLKARPNHARTWYCAATCMYRRFCRFGSKVSENDSFLKIFRRSYPDVSLDISIIKMNKKRAEDTLETLAIIDFLYRSAISCNSKMVNCLKDYANFQLHSLQRPLQAMEFFEKAISIVPNHERTLQNLARLQSQRGMWQEAFTTVQQSLKYFPNNPITCLEFALINFSLLDVLDGQDPRFNKRKDRNSKKGVRMQEQFTGEVGDEAPAEPGELEKRIERINTGIEYLSRTIQILNMQLQTMRERGYAHPRFFDTDELDTHASSSLRTSKLFSKVARCCMDYWARHRHRIKDGKELEMEGHSLKSFLILVENAWVAFRWSIHVIEMDKLYVDHIINKPLGSTARPFMKQGDAIEMIFVNRAHQMFRQWCFCKVTFAKYLTHFAAPDIDIPYDQAFTIKDEHQGRMNSFQQNLSTFTIKTGVFDESTHEKLEQALEMLRTVFNLDRREFSAGEMALFALLNFLNENGALKWENDQD